MKKTILLSIMVLLSLVVNASGTDEMSNDSVLLPVYFISNDSLCTVMDNLIVDVTGRQAKTDLGKLFFDLAISCREDSLFMCFVHTMSANDVIERKRGNLTTYIGSLCVSGCVIYNNMTFFVIHDKQDTRWQQYFTETDTYAMFKKCEDPPMAWEDSEGRRVYSVYLQSIFYVFDGKRKPRKHVGSFKYKFK